MAITKAEILTQVTLRLDSFASFVGDMDEELRAALYDLSSRDNFLSTTGTITTEDGTVSYDEPTLVRDIEDMAVDEGTRLTRTTFADYQQHIENTDSPTEGEPEEWVWWNGTIYFIPTADDAYTVNVSYYKFHANDVDTIEFGELFRACIYNGVLAHLFSGVLSGRPGAAERYALHKVLYEEEIQKRRAEIVRQPRAVKYTDI